MMGIPFRKYGMQQKVRFWSFFVLYDFILSNGFAVAFMDRKSLKDHEYYLYDTKERQL